jgi:hypothetical protein
MNSFTPKMYAWRWPLWPVTAALCLACLAIGIFIMNDGAEPAIGTVVVVVTIIWLVLGQYIGPKLRAQSKPEA